MSLSSFVVPIQGDANVPGSIPFRCNRIIFFKCFLEVERMFLAEIFYSEIIDYQRELYRAPCVLPKAWDELALLVSFLVESLFE